MSTMLVAGHIRPIHYHGARLYVRVRTLTQTVHDGAVWDASGCILYTTAAHPTREAVYAELEVQFPSESSP